MRLILVVLLALFASTAHAAGSPWTASWIWSPAPEPEVWFRKTIHTSGQVRSAKIAITVDNEYQLYVNGTLAGSGDDWTKLGIYDVTSHIRQGANVIAVYARDTGGQGGLLLQAAITVYEGSPTFFGSDSSWRLSTNQQDGWEGVSFDDSSWEAPEVIGAPPVGPWGGIPTPDILPRAKVNIAEWEFEGPPSPGETASLTLTLGQMDSVPVDSPVGVRFLLNGEPVWEHWSATSVDATHLKQGDVLTFADIHVPSYAPQGSLTPQLVGLAIDGVAPETATESRPKPGAPVVDTPRLEVWQVGRELHLSTPEAGQPFQPCILSLMKGQEMWLAEEVSSPDTRIHLPEDLPRGLYQAVLLPHNAMPARSAAVEINIGSGGNNRQAIGYGTFQDRNGIPHRWYVNRAGTLIWDGEPYIPAGAMFISKFFLGYRMNATEQNEENFQDDINRLTAMKQAGVTDLYLNPCTNWNDRPIWVWQRVIDLFEEMGFHYGLQVTNELSRLRYYDITDQEYTVSVVPGETAEVELTSTLLRMAEPDMKVLFAAFDPETGTLLQSGEADVSGSPGAVVARAEPGTSRTGAVKVHFTPVYTYTGGMRDYWKDVNNQYEQTLNTFFGSLKLGPRMRGWIDPLDNEQSFQDPEKRFLPHSAEFQSAFARHLRQRYPTPQQLTDAWAVSTPLQEADFAAMGRVVPIGRPSPASDLLYVLDETTGKTWTLLASESRMWDDLLEFRDRSVAAFNNQVAEMIKSHHGAPVVLKHEGSDLFWNTRKHGGFDGIGAEAYGQDNTHIRSVSASVHAQHLRSGRTMWELTTETGLAAPEVGYPTPSRMLRDLTSMLEEGGKGTYVFLIKDASGDPMSDWYTFNLFEDPRQLEWLGAYARMLQSAGPALASYTPETYQGDDFWHDILGAEVLDLGPAFQAIRIGSVDLVWNMTESELPLTRTRQGSANAPESSVITPNAEAVAVFTNADRHEYAGVDEANLLAARRLWNRASARATQLGLGPGDAPSTWQELWPRALELEASIGDAPAMRMADVTVDADLWEWQNVELLRLKEQHDVTDSTFDGADIYVGYDDDYLYVAGTVADANISNNNGMDRLWDGDGLEVFLDLQPDADPDNPAPNANTYQFIFAPTSATGKPAFTLVHPAVPPGSAPGNTAWAVKPTPEGWQFEAAISRQDIGGFEFTPGRQIGLEIQLDQSDGAERVRERLWHGRPDAFMNRAGYGRLVFAGTR